MFQQPCSHVFPSLSKLVFAVLLTTAIAALFFAQAERQKTAAVSIGQTQLVRDKRPATASSRQFEAAQAYGKLPLAFQANEGQTNSQVRFLARGQGYALFLTETDATFVLNSTASGPDADASNSKTPPAVVSMKLAGARRAARISGLEELPGKLNYFIGNNKAKWRTNISTYAKVRYQQSYPGIDVLYRGNQRHLEYDFLVAPRANPGQIKLAFKGTDEIRVDENGDLLLSTPAGIMRQLKPVAYQEIGGERKEVSAKYRVDQNNVTFELGDYDKRLPLVIDPELIYSTFFGGSSVELGLDIAVDSAGNAYLTGSTTSTDFPVAGAFQSTKGNVDDAFVAKLNAAGTALVYSTYLGANGSDVGNAIAIDAQGNAYVVGLTGSGSFPTTPGPFQSPQGSLDAFIVKLNPTGSALVYSNILGGDNNDNAFGVAVDLNGRAHVVGRTDSSRFSFGFVQRNGSPAHKSIDTGAQWSPSGAELTASSVSSLAFDPSNSNILYAGTNYGVFKSSTAGAHWNLTGTVRTSTAPVFTSSVAVDPSNPSIVYATATNGIFKSTDGGALYDIKNTGLNISFTNVITIDPNTPTTLYAGTLLGIFKSTNGGDNWAEIRNGISGSVPRVNKIVIDPSNSSIVYMGTTRGMYKTTNGGALWVPLNSGPLSSSFIQITALAIDPTNPSVLYASGFNGLDILFKTIDGGATWTAASSGLTFTTINNLAVDPVTPATLYAATAGASLYKSTNGGTNWSLSNTGLPNVIVNAVAIDRNNPATVYAGTTIGNDAFAMRLDPSGTAAEYFSNFGGSESDEARGVALDTAGNAYIAGFTSSTNFPVVNAMQASSGGLTDGFVAKLNSSGTAFGYATYLGGSGTDQARGIAVRGDNAYVAGATNSANFPLVNAFKSTLVDFDTDAFACKVNSTGAGLDFSSFLGGSTSDQGFDIAVDTNGSAYVTGLTSSTDFPALSAPQPGLNGGNDAFVTKLNPAGSSIAYSSYLGGTLNDQGNGIAVDGAGNVYVIGTTSSTNFPTARPLQPALKGTDAFITKLGVLADLSISKKESRDPVMINNPLSYSLKVTNSGPSPVTGVTVTDVLPNGLSFVSANSTLGSCSFSNSTVTCAIGNMPLAGQVTITIAVTPTVVGTFNNTATVTASEPDDNLANNTSTETTKVSASPSINGFVRDTNGVALSDVLMTLTGSQSATTQTDSTGFYQFAELPAGGNYVITPTKANFSIDPASRTFNSLNSDQSADFVASTCTYSIAPAIQSFGSAGGSGTVNVTSLHDCPWTAVSFADWITVTSGSSGSGSGVVNFSVSATTVPRSGHITVAGKNFAIYQEFNSCGTPAFSQANYNLPYRSITVLVGDLNGDGLQDVLLESGQLINNGNGGFSVGNFNFGSELQGMVLADLNSDGRPDVAATTYNSSNVQVFFNNGSGGFGQSSKQVPFDSQGQSPLTRGMFAADLNHDGKNDFVVSTPGTNGVQVLLGDGAGNFTQVAPVSAPQLVLIGIADVNADGNPDLIFAGGGDNDRPVTVRLGDGLGGFGSAIVAVGTRVTKTMATGDFNSDGKLDLAVSSLITVGSGFSGGITILTGDGAGHFSIASSVDAGHGLANVVAGDFNADGKTDVAYVTGGSKVTVVPGNGAGGFGTPLPIDTGASDCCGGNYGIGVGDFDGNSKPDLALGDYIRGASVLLNKCSAPPSISGRITDSRNNGGLTGATVTLSGAQSATTQTDGSGNYSFSNLSAGMNYVVTPAKDNFRFTPPNATFNNLAGIQTANFVGTPITLQFTTQDFVVDENAGSIQISVRRLGDLSGITTVDYSTVANTASPRTDYTAPFGTLRFAAGENLKTFRLLVTDDNLVEGWEQLNVVLSNPVGAIFHNSSFEGQPPMSLVEIRDNDFGAPTTNPLDDTQFFVLQHYYDFLNRVPDPGGFTFWTGQITQCGNNPACIHNKRMDVSNAFFYELEYQQTGAYVYRLYRAAFGNDQPFPNANPDPAHPGEEKKVLNYSVFAPDRSRVIGGSSLAQSQLDLANAFVLRPEFLSKYPASLDGPAFVDAMLATLLNDLGVNLSSQSTALINLFNSGGRGAVIYRLADDNATNPIDNRALIDAEYNRAFVATQYFGYLRRNPDMAGFLFWLGQVSSAPLRDVQKQHAMVCSFVTSTEYQRRFSLVVSHSNTECQ